MPNQWPTLLAEQATLNLMTTRNKQKRVLKRLKRRFGVSIDLLSKDSGTLNPLTGSITVTEDLHNIKRAIVMPAREKSDFVYDIAYLAANKNFTSGGFFNSSTVDLIVDGSDLPEDYDFSKTNTVVIAKREYEFVDHKDYMLGVGYVIRLKYLHSYGNRP